MTSATTSSDRFLSVPDDYLASFDDLQQTLAMIEFLLKRMQIKYKSTIRTVSLAGTPKYYARFDVDNFILAPTPNSNYSVELHYYYRPTSLADSTIELTVASCILSLGCKQRHTIWCLVKYSCYNTKQKR